jgi:hypothetical protein
MPVEPATLLSLVNPLFGRGSQNSGQNIDESLDARGQALMRPRVLKRVPAVGRRVAGKSALTGDSTEESQTSQPGT